MEERQEEKPKITAYRLAKRMKTTPERIIRAIKNGQLLAEKKDGRWNIDEKVALVYMRDFKENHTQNMPAYHRKRNVLNFDVCSSCGIKNTNLVGDIRSGEKYGYLCSRCQKLLIATNGDYERLEKFYRYMRKTK